jgi:hypothetical protein
MTMWNVITYEGGKQNDELSMQGFRLPGLITVLHSRLWNELDSELSPPPRGPDELALMAPWLPRVGNLAKAEFSMRFSNPVPALTDLHVMATADFLLRAEDLKMFPFNTTGYRKLIRTESSPSANASSSIVVTILDPLSANKDYVIILPLRTASNIASVSQWHFELRDSATLPMQTNDAQLPGFKLAEVFSLGVTVGHAPPSADILVTLFLDFGTATPNLLSIVPPLTFDFPSNCSTSASIMCVPGMTEGRTVAQLVLPSGDAFKTSATVEIKAISPSTDPALRAWALEGLSVPVDEIASIGFSFVGGTQVGWGEYRLGFMLTPLQQVVIRYAAVPLITTSLSLSFNIAYRDGRSPTALRVTPPTSYRISCSKRHLKLVSSPDKNITCTPEPFTLKLHDGSAFPEGRQTFVVEVRVPSRTPEVAAGSENDAFFRILLLDSAEDILDANAEIPAMPVQTPLLQTDQSFLEWTSSDPGATTTITFGFRLKRSLPPSGQTSGSQAGENQLIQVAALLLEMPFGFQHLITVKEDVKNLNNEFPVAESSGASSWAEYDSNSTIGSVFDEDIQPGHNLRLLRIIRDQSQRVPVGTYGFSLPVRVPVAMPPDNVWHLSLCSAVTCSSVDDAGVMISFILPGFRHGEVPPTAKIATGLLSSSHRPAFTRWVSLLILALQVRNT